jgi:3-(3-hydroxy-phenyl)propionate hydroxylase
VRRLADGRDGWLLRELHGSRFVALLFGGGPDAAAQVAALRAGAQGLAPLAVLVVVPRGAAAPDVADAVVLEDREGLLAQRYDGAPGTVYLLRPDQHVCARWRRPDGPALGRAMRRALCLPGG